MDRIDEDNNINVQGDMDEQELPLHELLRKFATSRGLPIKENQKGLACRMSDKTILKLFHRPVIHGGFICYGIITDLSENFLRNKYIGERVMKYLRKKLEENILTSLTEKEN